MKNFNAKSLPKKYDELVTYIGKCNDVYILQHWYNRCASIFNSVNKISSGLSIFEAGLIMDLAEKGMKVIDDRIELLHAFADVINQPQSRVIPYSEFAPWALGIGLKVDEAIYELSIPNQLIE